MHGELPQRHHNNTTSKTSQQHHYQLLRALPPSPGPGAVGVTGPLQEQRPQVRVRLPVVRIHRFRCLKRCNASQKIPHPLLRQSEIDMGGFHLVMHRNGGFEGDQGLRGSPFRQSQHPVIRESFDRQWTYFQGGAVDADLSVPIGVTGHDANAKERAHGEHQQTQQYAVSGQPQPTVTIRRCCSCCCF